MYQVGAGLCLAVGGADIRVASASARFPSSQYLISAGFLFCTSLTWICVLCNEYGQWSSFWIQSPPGWGWLSPSWVYTLAWRRLIFSPLLLDLRWWDNFLGRPPIAVSGIVFYKWWKCHTGFKVLHSLMYSCTICEHTERWRCFCESQWRCTMLIPLSYSPFNSSTSSTQSL